MATPALPTPNPVRGAPTQRRSCGHHDSNHIVQFYEREDHLYDGVARFLANGLAAGEPCLIIATEEHARAIAARMALNGFDPDVAGVDGTFTVLDARQTLGRFMDGEMPDRERFGEAVGGVIDRIVAGAAARRASTSRIRAFGEMVDLLCGDGNIEGAVQLEELWNELASVYSFSLLCAYRMESFEGEAGAERFREICDQHRHVVPAESRDPWADFPTWMREVSVLQHRIGELEAELERQRERVTSLGEAKDEAERANREMSELLVRICHELRTPLSAIAGYEGLLSEGISGPVNPRQAQHLAGIREASREQLSLIEQILGLAGNGAAPPTGRNYEPRFLGAPASAPVPRRRASGNSAPLR
jgi:signal transduction histidine kinase